jgi:hypothetical protein
MELLRINKKAILKQFEMNKRIYKNKKSGIYAYESRSDSIIVEYKDGRIYLYTNDKPGKEHVKLMKENARRGKELGSYINRNVGNNYALRLK